MTQQPVKQTCSFPLKTGGTCKRQVHEVDGHCWQHNRTLRHSLDTIVTNKTLSFALALFGAISGFTVRDLGAFIYAHTPAGRREILKGDALSLSQQLYDWNNSCFHETPERHQFCEDKVDGAYNAYYAKRVEKIAKRLREIGKPNRELEDRIHFHPYTDDLTKLISTWLKASSDSL